MIENALGITPIRSVDKDMKLFLPEMEAAEK